MEEKTAPIIALLKQFNQESEELFLEIADGLPSLLTELSDDLSPWSGKRDKELKLFEDNITRAYQFILLAYQEDLALFDQTHYNLHLTLNSDSSNEDILRKEKRLNRLLREAERKFVVLFTYEETILEQAKTLSKNLKIEALTALSELDRRMNEMTGLLKKAHRPVLLAMESIQNQDIMRQSINHAMMALEQYNHDELDDELEKVTFQVNLIELAMMVVDEVSELLEGVKLTLTSKVSVIEDQLRMITQQKRVLEKEIEGSDFSQTPSYHLEKAAITLKGADRLYVHYLYLKTKIIKEHHLVVRLAQSFMDEVSGDDALLKKMDKISSLIDAELPSLYDTVGYALKQSQDYEETRNFLLTSMDSMTILYSKMKDIIVQEHVYNSKVTGCLETIMLHSNHIDHIAASLDESRKLMLVLCQELKISQKRLLEDRHLDSWTLKGNKMNELIAKFTILSHKQAAGKIAGFDVDSSSTDGDFIFF